jgi:hypothetical protein
MRTGIPQMSAAPEAISLERPRVDMKTILRLQGHRQLEAVSPVVAEAARRMAALARTLVEPRAWVWRGAVRRAEPDGLVALVTMEGAGTEGQVEFRSRALARMMRKANEAAVILLTIGPRLEQRAQELVASTELLEGLLLDTAGWVAVNALLKTLRERLSAEARTRCLHLTGRMAPGFADWPLEEQRLLFGVFRGTNISVRLTEACAMLPVKSVTGLYGLVPSTR